MLTSLWTLTYSLFCSVPISEKAVKDVITFLLRTFAVLGTCKMLKTDNAPAYTATTFQEFWQQFGITHITVIPYNPWG